VTAKRSTKRMPRILFFGTYDQHKHARLLVLEEGLAHLGLEIDRCTVPLNVDTALRVEMLRRPWLGALFAGRLGTAWWRLRDRTRRLPRPDVVVVGYLGAFDVHLARRLFPRSYVVLDGMAFLAETAVDRGTTSSALIKVLTSIDHSAVRAADITLVHTEEHLSLLPEDVRNRGVVVAMGSPRHWFSPPAPISSPPLKVIFHGSYIPLHGTPVIGQAIRLLSNDKNIHFSMVGRGQDYERTRREAGSTQTVTWVDWVDSDQMPMMVSDHHVCLGIFSAGPKMQRVVPHKVYEGAARGCVIVTGESAAQRWALGEAGVFVPPGNPDALASTLRELAANREKVEALRQATYRRAEEAFRPETVIKPLHERMTAVLSMEA
jgi:glycosyltransferase involved in cell wall biosynthesis